MTTSKHHATLPEDRIPLREKIGFTLGGIGMGATTHVVFGLISPIFNMILGVSPALISTAMFIQSMATSLFDPLMGQFSDNFRSRWGRRKPLMLIFAFPLALLTVLLYWFPRGLSEHQLFLWILCIVPLVTLCSAAYGLPFSALAVESTPDYHERVRLGVFTGFFGAAVAIAYQWIFPLIQQPFFGNAISGVRWVALAAGSLCVVMTLAPVVLCPEKRYVRQTRKLERAPLLRNLAEARKNKPFLIIGSIKFFTFFCYTMVGGLGMYMNTYFIYGGDVKKASITYAFLGSAYVLAGLLSLFLFKQLAQALGKRRTLQIAAGVLMTGCVMKLFIYDPAHPWWQLIVLIANGASTTGLHFVTGTMVGDIIDYDEFLFGKRREALYGSLLGLSEKFGNTFGGLISGFLLVWIGFNAKYGAQTPHTLHLMQMFYFALPFTGALFAFVIIRFYEITEERAYQIKDELTRRLATAAPAPVEASEIETDALVATEKAAVISKEIV